MKSLTLKELLEKEKTTLKEVAEKTDLSLTVVRGIFNETYPVSEKIRKKFSEIYNIYLIDKTFANNVKDTKTEMLELANEEIDKKILKLQQMKEENIFNIKLNTIVENAKELYSDEAFRKAVERLYDYVIEKTEQPQKKVETKPSNKVQKPVEEVEDTPKKEEVEPIVEKPRKKRSITIKEAHDIRDKAIANAEDEAKEEEAKANASSTPSVSIELEEIHTMSENEKEEMYDEIIDDYNKADYSYKREDCYNTVEDADNNPLDTYYPASDDADEEELF